MVEFGLGEDFEMDESVYKPEQDSIVEDTTGAVGWTVAETDFGGGTIQADVHATPTDRHNITLDDKEEIDELTPPTCTTS